MTSELADHSTTIYIPQEVRDLPLSYFRFTTRLSNILERLNFRQVGDLHNFSFDEFSKMRGYGVKLDSELRSFVSSLGSNEFSAGSRTPENIIVPTELKDLLFIIDRFFSGLKERDQVLLNLRFGADSVPLTLDEAGEPLNLSKERVRQIESREITQLRSQLGSAGKKIFEQLIFDCLENVRPFTAELLTFYLKKDASEFGHRPFFYVQLFDALVPELPIFPTHRMVRGAPRSERLGAICREIKNALASEFGDKPLKSVFAELQKLETLEDLDAREFLESLEYNNNFAINFDSPDDPKIKLTAKRGITNIARRILEESDRPLLPEELLERAQIKLDSGHPLPSLHALSRLPFEKEGFYLLDSRAIGLRKHFRLPPEQWEQVRNDFFNLLKKKKHPVSTREVIAKKLFKWAVLINASEMAEIIGRDSRFSDLGRFHFALAKWKIEKREFIKDAVVEILRQAQHPLKAKIISCEIQKSRSMSKNAVFHALRQNELVQEYGVGYYGLKEWGDSYYKLLISDTEFVDRIVAYAFPPLTFGDLCRTLRIEQGNDLSKTLWETLTKISKVNLSSAHQAPETLITYKMWRLRRRNRKNPASAK